MKILLMCALFLGACAPLSGSVTVSNYRSPPGYVFTYADGSCWADDVWYVACPWPMGPNYGYHYSYRGYYHWEPRAYWGYRHQAPPVYWHRGHRHYRPHYRYAPPRHWRRR